MVGIFVTATDTDVGKSVISAGIARCLKTRGLNVGIMKPFATADYVYSSKFRSADTALLAESVDSQDPDNYLNPSFYNIAASPYAASRIKNEKEPDIFICLQAYRKLASVHDFMVVEGIGGIAVPLNSKHSVIDFVRLLDLPVLVISKPVLGTLNHTFLTVKMLRDSGVAIAGIIVNFMPDNPSRVERETIRIMEEICSTRVIGLIPRLKVLDPQAISTIIEKNVDLEQILKSAKI